MLETAAEEPTEFLYAAVAVLVLAPPIVVLESLNAATEEDFAVAETLLRN